MPDETVRATDYIQILANVVDYLRRRDTAVPSQQAALPMPDETVRATDYIQILANVVDYLRRRDTAVPSQVIVTRSQYDTPFRVYQLDTLFYQLVSNIPCGSNEGFPKESLVLPTLKKDPFKYSPGLACEPGAGVRGNSDTCHYQLVSNIPCGSNEGFPKESLVLPTLKKDPFKYSPGLACEIHEADKDTEADKSVECTSSRATRWAFTVLDFTCALLNIRPQPGRHVPNDYAIDEIIAYKEECRGGARGEHFAPDDTPVSFNTSASSTQQSASRDTSFASAASTTTAIAAASKTGAPTTAGEKKRVHVPLRMPKTDYGMSVRAAPDLTTDLDDFPPLPGARHSPGAPLTGRGRGRGLAANFQRLQM
ncbi:piRNA pathway germ-plasm component domain-containing protein [Phthorimaea operculella]|nr:piRNA pathway germ-plasm component domain-containing protein [Phthorimaea operculella]